MTRIVRLLDMLHLVTEGMRRPSPMGTYGVTLGRLIAERREATAAEQRRNEALRNATPERQQATLAGRYAEIERRLADLDDRNQHLRSRDEVRIGRYTFAGQELEEVLQDHKMAAHERLGVLSEMAAQMRLKMPESINVSPTDEASVERALMLSQAALARADMAGQRLARQAREPVFPRWPNTLRNLLVYVPAAVSAFVLCATAFAVAPYLLESAGPLLALVFFAPLVIGLVAVFVRDRLVGPVRGVEGIGPRQPVLAMILCYVPVLYFCGSI